MIGFASLFVSEHYGGPRMLYALLLGMALNFLYTETRCREGINLTSREILRIGVALLGVRITFEEIASLGLATVALAVTGIIVCIVVGWRLARLLGLSNAFGLLTSGATAICGASAALAISSVLPKSKSTERDTILAVIGVTTLSTIVMIIYPLLVGAFGFSDREAGIFFGATIHDVAQVIGAGGMVSEEAKTTAAIVKLMRVALLLPVVIIFSMVARRWMSSGDGQDTGKRPPLLPGFLVAFIALVTINSFVTIPPALVGGLKHVSDLALVSAISALGLKTSLRQLTVVGWRPIVLMIAQTVVIGVYVLLALLLTGVGG